MSSIHLIIFYCILYYSKNSCLRYGIIPVLDPSVLPKVLEPNPPVDDPKPPVVEPNPPVVEPNPPVVDPKPPDAAVPKVVFPNPVVAPRVPPPRVPVVMPNPVVPVPVTNKISVLGWENILPLSSQDTVGHQQRNQLSLQHDFVKETSLIHVCYCMLGDPQ